LAALTTGPHFANSASMNAFKSAGVPPAAYMVFCLRNALPLSLAR
jgi:hypothetical protein